jgi:hypothetical protein
MRNLKTRRALGNLEAAGGSVGARVQVTSRLYFSQSATLPASNEGRVWAMEIAYRLCPMCLFYQNKMRSRLYFVHKMV